MCLMDKAPAYPANMWESVLSKTPRPLAPFLVCPMCVRVQIVTLLSILIFGYDQSIAAIYIILLALLNDITMVCRLTVLLSKSAQPQTPKRSLGGL